MATIIALVFPGIVVADRFTLGDRLGGGGAGVVFAARDRDGKSIVIKLARNASAAVALAREAEALRELSGLSLVPSLVGSGHDPSLGRAWLAMERVDGDDLAHLLAKGGISAREAFTLFAKLADALAALHERSFFHGDLSPTNVRLRDEGVVLLDLGNARRASEEQGTTEATPRYAAPERASGRNDAGTDLYALGKMLAEALGADVPSLDPALRPSDAREVARSLRELAITASDAARRRVVHLGYDEVRWGGLIAIDAGITDRIATMMGADVRLVRPGTPSLFVVGTKVASGRVVGALDAAVSAMRSIAPAAHIGVALGHFDVLDVPVDDVITQALDAHSRAPAGETLGLDEFARALHASAESAPSDGVILPRELASLTMSLELEEDEPCRVTLVVGDGGIGKSRLLAMTAAAARARGSVRFVRFDDLPSPASTEARVLVVDDLDRAAVADLRAFAASLATLRGIVVLAAARDVRGLRDAGLTIDHEVRLGEWNDARIEELARSMGFPDSGLAALPAGGNPRRLLAMMRGPDDNRLLGLAAHDALDALDPELRRRARHAALLTSPFSLPAIVEATGEETARIAADLEALVDADILLRSRDEDEASISYAFRVSTVRDAAASSSTARERALLSPPASGRG